LNTVILMMEGAREARKRLADADCEGLLAGIAQGDPEVFAQFYQATDRAIYAYALSLTRSHHDAQDVMMDTYLKIRSAAHLYRPGGKPMAWVFTIVKNLVRDRWRQGEREELMGDVPEGELAIPDTDRSDAAMVLRQAMRVLSREEREIVLLHAVSGLKHREIAAMLERPLSTVLSRYHRALGKLRNALAEEEV
ncbi:RNA polymerase sigma factor, partial [Flavonifractor sp. An92]|uniref:RNA polymerase sigma factor n=1 Tax=Flavonifractor sp. An92 TaxID=1965666 RepID=UPI0031B8956F